VISQIQETTNSEDTYLKNISHTLGGYEKPTAFMKAPAHIEVLLGDYIQNKIKISYNLQ